VNGVLVHSKLETANFPDFEEVAKIVEEASKGEEPQKVNYVMTSSAGTFIRCRFSAFPSPGFTPSPLYFSTTKSRN
jgi:hypothetical protein